MMEDYKSSEYLECSCTGLEHTLRMTYFKDTPDYIYIETHLRQQPFYQRLIPAIKYLFGFRSRYGDYDEFIWDPSTVKRFQEFSNNFINSSDEYYEKIKSCPIKWADGDMDSK